jgi:psiF repeat
MRRYAFISAMLIAVVLMLPSAPSLAVSAKDKMATCKFGADDQKLAGAPRNAFMKKCMSNHNDPRGTGGGAPAAAAVPPPPKQ